MVRVIHHVTSFHQSRCPGAGGHGRLVAGVGVIAVTTHECMRADSCTVCRGGSRACNDS